MACTIPALPRPLGVLMVPPFLQQLPIPFQVAALMEFCFLPSEEHQRYGTSIISSTITLATIVNQVHVVQQCISLTVQILLLNLATLLDPKGRTMNKESIVSASQIMVKQQGLKQQKQTNHGADHENVKLWCIGMEVVGISKL